MDEDKEREQEPSKKLDDAPKKSESPEAEATDTDGGDNESVTSYQARRREELRNYLVGKGAEVKKAEELRIEAARRRMRRETARRFRQAPAPRRGRTLTDAEYERKRRRALERPRSSTPILRGVYRVDQERRKLLTVISAGYRTLQGIRYRHRSWLWYLVFLPIVLMGAFIVFLLGLMIYLVVGGKG